MPLKMFNYIFIYLLCVWVCMCTWEDSLWELILFDHLRPRCWAWLVRRRQPPLPAELAAAPPEVVWFPAQVLDNSKLPITPASGDWMLSSGLCGYLYTYSLHSNTYMHKLIIFFLFRCVCVCVCLPECKFMYHIHAVPTEAKRGLWIPRN